MGIRNIEAETAVFESVVRILSGYIKTEDKAFILIAPPIFLSFEILDMKSLKQDLSQVGLTQGDFERMRASAAEYLIGILSNQEKAVQKRQTNRILGQDDDDAEPTQEADIVKFAKNEARKRLEMVRKSHYSSHLQRRYDLKRSSKAPSFNNIEWDIKIKVHDSGREVHNFPYATLKFGFQRDFEDNPFSLLGGRTFEALQMNFSGDEIAYLKYSLERVLGLLRVEEEKCKSN